MPDLVTADRPRGKDGRFTSSVAEQQRQRTTELLALMRQRFRRNSEAEGPLRARMLDDLVFSANLSGTDQWDPRAVEERTTLNRPYLTIDRLSQPIYSLVNQHRESGASLQVTPVDQGADPKTADIIQGLLRNIANQSRAWLAYTWGVESAVRMGRGFVRILPEWVSDRSFDQDLRIKRVLNPFSVYPDCAAEEPDYSDAECYHVIQDLTPEEYRAEYGEDSELGGSLDDFSTIGDQVPLWFPNGHVRIAEYYHITHRLERLLLFRGRDGRPLPVWASEVEKLQAFLATRGETLGGQAPERERPVDVRQVKWAKVNGVEILKETDVPGRWIPIVPVVGEELFVNGEHDFRGIVRGAKEAARVYNTQVTALIEAVGLIPKNPFMIAAGQVKGFEHFWRDANVTPFAYLPYNEISVAGRLVPPPQRNPAAPALQPLVVAVAQADNDIKVATRYFDASLGREGPESSGVAIRERQRQGSTGTSHFEANFRDITLSHVGRILVEQLPFYYDAPRTARIIGEDEQMRAVQLNAPFTDEQGQTQLYDLSTGTYDVVVAAGPGFPTKQAQNRELLTTVLQASPQTFPLIGDLFMKALGLYDIAKRLERTLPPGLREPTEGTPPIPPEVQQHLDALMQEHEALKSAFADAKQRLDTQGAKAEIEARAQALQAQLDARLSQLELASKERIATAQIDQKGQAELEETRRQLAILHAELAQKTKDLMLQNSLERVLQQSAQQHEILMQLLKERGAKEVERHKVELHDQAAAAASATLGSGTASA